VTEAPPGGNATPSGAGPVPNGAHAGGPRVDVPETRGYRWKLKLLGPPLNTEELAHERLGKPTALAVFASDNLSSSAYATEEILRVLVPVVGVAAFSLVVPVTTALLIVLGFLILSYRQTIKAYPSAGGAYIVTKDNLGKVPALVAGVSLLTDYILTVAVSTAAGTAALISAVPSLGFLRIPLTLFFIVIIAFGNLRGVKESGRVFAVPTYFFLINMLLLLVVGGLRATFGHLPQAPLNTPGLVPIGNASNGLFYGATLFVVLRAFASGGAAVTGVEAISNGVPAFKEPAWKNARSTLVVMGTFLGIMFFGLSTLAAKVHAAPFEKGTPTVISQVGKLVYGTSPIGHLLFYALQAGTMLILVLAANTSFADFPRLASFAATDRFMPRQLAKRGHRLVFSNGIISLAAVAGILVLATEARVDRLIPLYAIGVFTSFTMSQAGMAKHHVTHKEEGWRVGLFINGMGAVLSFLVAVILAITKFSEGAWVIMVAVPILVVLLIRLNHQYVAEAAELEEDAPRAAEAPILRRHVVIVLLDQLDLAAARAIQYARTLMPDELRAIHFAVDTARAAELQNGWRRLGLSRIPLDVISCPDRRITRAAVELVADELADGDTEVLHDRTSNSIAEAMVDLPHANVTFVPYHLGRSKRQVTIEPSDGNGGKAGKGGGKAGKPAKKGAADPNALPEIPAGAVHPGGARYRERVTVAGKVYSVRVQPRAGSPSLECTLKDASGQIVLVFMGRRHVAGVEPGALISATGMVGQRSGRLEILNPDYRLLAEAEGPH